MAASRQKSAGQTARGSGELARKTTPPPGKGAPLEPADQRLYRAVLESVMNRRLPPGTKLPEVALCELFGVGRTVVRRVLQALAHDHIVELRHNRGAVVATPSPEETRQVFEARRGIEATILRLAIARATEDDLRQLQRHLDQEAQEWPRGDQAAWAGLASGFHRMLAQLAANPYLERYLAEIVSRCSLIVSLYEPPGHADCEHAEHRAIVERMAARDTDGAIEMMEQHLAVLERNICLSPPDKPGSLKQMLGMEG